MQDHKQHSPFFFRAVRGYHQDTVLHLDGDDWKGMGSFVGGRQTALLRLAVLFALEPMAFVARGITYGTTSRHLAQLRHLPLIKLVV